MEVNDSEKIEAFILAGGSSRRMGKNKALLSMGEGNILEMITSRLTPFFKKISFSVAASSGLDAFLDNCIFDERERFGPIEGIRACLEASSSFHAFFIACDMPFANIELIKYLLSRRTEFDAVVPRRGALAEPLFAIYSKSCLNPLNNMIEKGDKKILILYDHIKVRFVEEDEISLIDPLFHSFQNINTPDDFERAMSISDYDRILQDDEYLRGGHDDKTCNINCRKIKQRKNDTS